MHRLALILALTSACAANGGDEGFAIVKNLVPQAGCALQTGGAFLSRGIIDVESPNPYVFTPEIVSRISGAEGTEAQRTIVLRGAKIEVIDPNGQITIPNNKFTSLFSATLPPLGTTTASFDIITPQILDSLSITGNERIQLLAKITPFGALGGSGDEVDGVTFQYPVTVCRGCVANNLGMCPLPSNTVVPPGSANTCNPYQDGMTYCCMGPTGLVCPATVGQQFTLTVAKTGAAAMTATVASQPVGINCGMDCTESYDQGTMVTLTASGATNVTWTGAAGCTTGPTCTVTIAGMQTVSVQLQ